MSAKRKGRRRGKAPSKRAMRARARWIVSTESELMRVVKRMVTEKKIADAMAELHARFVAHFDLGPLAQRAAFGTLPAASVAEDVRRKELGL